MMMGRPGGRWLEAGRSHPVPLCRREGVRLEALRLVDECPVKVHLLEVP